MDLANHGFLILLRFTQHDVQQLVNNLCKRALTAWYQPNALQSSLLHVALVSVRPRLLSLRLCQPHGNLWASILSIQCKATTYESPGLGLAALL